MVNKDHFILTFNISDGTNGRVSSCDSSDSRNSSEIWKVVVKKANQECFPVL